MTDATSGPLRDAYEAIQANQLPKARGILSVYVSEKPDDPDAWWLYSYAAENPTEARKSLENVLRLDPMYPGARDLLNDINQSVGLPIPSISQPLTGIQKLGDEEPSVSKTLSVKIETDDDFDDIDLDELDDDDEPSSLSRNRLLLAIAGFVLVVLLIAFVFVVLPGMNNRTPTVTNVAVNTLQPTDASIVQPSPDATVDNSISLTPEPSVEVIVDIPTNDSGLQSTDAPVTTQETPVSLETAVISFDGFYTALNGFTVTPDSIAIDQTSLGQTLNATICLQNQAELRNAIPTGISSIASVSQEASDEVEYIGVKFVNCADNSLLRYVVVPIADARAFAGGTLTAAQLRGSQINITR
jgi:hypothetical protein